MSAVADGFEEFQPVAVRVLGVEPAHPREVVVEPDRSARGAQPVSPGIQMADQHARMRLAGRAEVLLHAQVQLDAVAAEPAAAAGREHGRLRYLTEVQDAAIKVTQRVLAAGRAGQLNVMDHRDPRIYLDIKIHRKAYQPQAPLTRSQHDHRDALPEQTADEDEPRSPTFVAGPDDGTMQS